MNTYDAALLRGREAPEGHVPRIRRAAAGSGLDAVFASRYHLLAEDDDLALEFDGDDKGPQDDTAAAALQAVVDAAIADETPPEARRKARKPRTTPNP